jgi:hypothetical protein
MVPSGRRDALIRPPEPPTTRTDASTFVVVGRGFECDRRSVSVGFDNDPHDVLVERQRRDLGGVGRAQVTRFPSVGNELVIERRCVADDVAANALDSRRRDLLRENVHWLLVVPEARAERRVAHTAKIEVSGECAVRTDRSVAKCRRAEREVRPEPVECHGRRVHLHRRSRLQHLIGILLVECVTRVSDTMIAPHVPLLVWLASAAPTASERALALRGAVHVRRVGAAASASTFA